jgi:hypothetical protein
MTAPYKKRALGGWNHDKKQSNKDERSYEAKDIKDQTTDIPSTKGSPIKEINAKYKQINSKNNKEKQVQRTIRSVNWALKRCGGKVLNLKVKAAEVDGWLKSYYERLFKDCKNGIPELKKLVDDQELSSKIRRQIREVLDAVKGQTW